MDAASSRLTDLSVDIAGLKLSNPTMLAAGILGVSHKMLKRAVQSGAGAVVSPSIGIEAREGYMAPTVVKVKCGYVSALGVPNPGVNVFASQVRRLPDDFPLVVSLVGSEVAEFERMVSTLETTPAKAYEVNLSSPDLDPGERKLGNTVESVSQVVRAVKTRTKKPILVKISAEIEPLRVARVAYDNGADAITAINSISAMAIDTETGYPILSNSLGGLSGGAIKPIAVKCVYEIKKSLGIPVVGCGGIGSWEDAIEFFLAGASAIQLGSAVAERNLGIFRDVVKGVQSYLVRKKYVSVKEIVGLAHRH